MESEEAIAILIRVAQWLTVNNHTSSGKTENGRCCIVTEAVYGPVALSYAQWHDEDGTPREKDAGISVINRDEPESFRDFIPVCTDDSGTLPSLWQASEEVVDTPALESLPPEQLTRMALNALLVTRAYNYEI